MNPYETRRYLEEYLLFHYGRPRDICPYRWIPQELLRFHERLAREYVLPVRAGTSRALDLGCGVGRFAFELGQLVDEVTGVDNSASFIRAARRVALNGAVTVLVKETGAQFTTRRLVLPRSARRAKVKFQVGDAMDLRAFVSEGYQVVAAINLICRLPRPAKFLGQLARLISPGGQLIIATPFSWLPEYTSAPDWLNKGALEKLLRPHFRLVRHGDLPFMIREHRRKYQLVVAEVFTFVRGKRGT